jgi:hypothetical protein
MHTYIHTYTGAAPSETESDQSKVFNMALHAVRDIAYACMYVCIYVCINHLDRSKVFNMALHAVRDYVYACMHVCMYVQTMWINLRCST